MACGRYFVVVIILTVSSFCNAAKRLHMSRVVLRHYYGQCSEVGYLVCHETFINPFDCCPYYRYIFADFYCRSIIKMIYSFSPSFLGIEPSISIVGKWTVHAAGKLQLSLLIKCLEMPSAYLISAHSTVTSTIRMRPPECCKTVLCHRRFAKPLVDKEYWHRWIGQGRSVLGSYHSNAPPTAGFKLMHPHNKGRKWLRECDGKSCLDAGTVDRLHI